MEKKYNITEKTGKLLESLSLLQQASDKGADGLLVIYGEKVAEEFIDVILKAETMIQEALIESIKSENFKNNNNI